VTKRGWLSAVVLCDFSRIKLPLTPAPLCTGNSSGPVDREWRRAADALSKPDMPAVAPFRPFCVQRQPNRTVLLLCDNQSSR
jgi:hypothetical protein